MKYENKEAFEQVNMFGTGTPNTAYAKFFIGEEAAFRVSQRI